MVTFRNNKNNNRRPPFRSNTSNRRPPFRRNDETSKFSNNSNFQRKIPGRNNHNATKLIEKYNDLAREALANEDKILSENYFQHADHFTRVQNDQESNRLARVGTFPVDTKESSKNDEKNDELSKTDELSNTDEIKTISTEPEVKKIIKSSEKKSVAS
ncbi:DUF4167 domain-containing protein [Candidatus Pelagibacter sp.]|jgi:hypothetical protein|nr:DUF4167 domain-containing protein [Candidatus Pelagibacter sp.]